MCIRKLLVAGLAVVFVGVAMTIPAGAKGDATHTTYLTFSGPVALPGVSLGTGTYIFEIPEATADHSLVRVSSKDRRIVYLTAFTHLVQRPAGLKRDRAVSFAEGAPGRPQPIAVWWPEGSAGREFIYPKK
jgi:hypothetical protein